MYRSRRCTASTVTLLLASFAGLSGAEAGSAGDRSIAGAYARAARFLNDGHLVLNEELAPNWIDRSDRFWYRSDTAAGHTFVLVDARRNTVRPAFDHRKLAAALSAAAGALFTDDNLPFDHYEYVSKGRAIRFTAAAANWTCRLVDYQCDHSPDSVTVPAGAIASPDGKRLVYVKKHNLIIRDATTGEDSALTGDGEDGYGYEIGELDTGAVSGLQLGNRPAAFFSPDAQRLLAFRSDLRNVSRSSVTETVGGAPPLTHSFRYPVAGAKDIGQMSPVVFDLATGARIDVACPPFPAASLISTLWYPGQSRWGETIAWKLNGTEALFIGESRGYKATTLYAADVRTGEVRTMLTERSATYVNRNPILRIIGDKEILWSSERDGWNHLYRFDGTTGALENQITSGAWSVRDVLHVDSQGHWIYFSAGGREAGRDPYLRHLYRVRFDGNGLELLTPEDADHSVSFSPTGEYFIDTASRIDSPPVSVLRTASGKYVRTLERANIAPLLRSGWKFPEPFRALARDGKTEIFGAVFRPTNFDPRRQYPVIDAIYPGPQVIRVAKHFTFSNGSEGFDQALAELGFIVVTVDGMGTPFRSRAFREVSYGNLGDAGGLEDHIAAIRQLGERYPYLDLNRVGIWGFSAGGYAAARAVLKYPDFYRVAVSLSGDHELRDTWAEWSERFQGYPVDDKIYEQQANAPLAANLRGKLLLAYGSLDDIVDPAQTLQLVDALIAANKDFDLLVFPNRTHRLIDLGQGRRASMAMDTYFVRRLWDYFVKNLLDVEPPREFDAATVPVE